MGHIAPIGVTMAFVKSGDKFFRSGSFIKLNEKT